MVRSLTKDPALLVEFHRGGPGKSLPPLFFLLSARKMASIFRANAAEFPEKAKAPPRPGLLAHNKSLWITIGTHMNCRNMCRRATHHAPLCGTLLPTMCRIAAQFVIILTAICAISVPYGA